MSHQLQRIEPGQGLSSVDYPREKYNALAPVTVVGADASYLQRSVQVVQLDPDHNRGDCYPAPGTTWSKDANGNLLPDKVAPSKAALMRLAAAMGIVWQVDPIEPQSHRLMKNLCQGMGATAAMEMFNAVRYDCAYRVRFAVRDGSGWRFGTASYEWELETEKRKIERAADKAEAKAREKNKPFNRYTYAREQLEQVMNFRHQLAESKAILRAIRSTGIRQVYTRQDFAKPFAVQRVDVVVNTDDPTMAKAIAERALSSGTELFGTGPAPAALPASTAEDAPDFERAEREGRMEYLPPVDAVDEEEAQPAPGPAEASPSGGPSMPWDEPKKQSDGPTREGALSRVGSLWERVQAAGLQEKVGTLKPDASVSALVDWCEGAEEALKAAKGCAQ